MSRLQGLPRRAVSPSAPRVLLTCAVSLVVSAACLAPAAGAADRVYWANVVADTISYANLNGSGGGDVVTTGATMLDPLGVALDPAAGRIYWANSEGNKISFANLNGTGGGDLATGAATVSFPYGVALDPTAGRIYWANFSPKKISFANLNGTGGGDLTTTGATVNGPYGVALDPAAGRIYWANAGADKISYANLNGTGGADLATGAATVSFPSGVALDPAAGRIYWASQGASDRISYANLSGTGGGDLVTTGATVNNPVGVALDPGAGRVYWANPGVHKISFANLNGTGGGDLTTTGATVSGPNFPALLERPGGTGAPTIAGGSTVGSSLSCSGGSWTSDLVPAFLARAPRSFAFGWLRDGAAIPGASGSSITASAPGAYSCAVAATNEAGSALQASAPHAVSAGGATSGAFGARTLVTLKLSGRVPASGALKAVVENANGFEVTGSLGGETVNRVTVSRKRKVKLKAKSFRVAARVKKTVTLKLSKPLRTLLRRQRGLKLLLRAKVKDPRGTTRTVTKRVTARPKRR